MATTSFLYHSMGVKGYRYLRCEYSDGAIRHHIKQRRFRRRCRGCRARWHELVLDGQFEREFVGLPIGRRRQLVVLHGHLQLCRPLRNVCRSRHRREAVAPLGEPQEQPASEHSATLLVDLYARVTETESCLFQSVRSLPNIKETNP